RLRATPLLDVSCSDAEWSAGSARARRRCEERRGRARAGCARRLDNARERRRRRRGQRGGAVAPPRRAWASAGDREPDADPGALRVAGALLERGVDPESIYESVYASAPEGRVRLMTEVLQTLVVEPEAGLAWVTVPPDALHRHGATADDLDGIVEYPRSIAGVR